MGVKKYFRNELEWSNFNLEHDVAPDFYLGCWQKNRSSVPLLFVRAILCAGNIAIVIASMVLLRDWLGRHGYWWIYLTQWGIVANALTTIFAFGLSFRVYINGPIDSSFGLPWYIKVYWFLYNATAPVAFLITIFYWSMLSGLEELGDVDPVIDIFIHGINSVMALALILTARQPSRFLHFYHSLAFGIFYLIFNLIYYAAGGTDPNGNVWVYPMLDWTIPGPTIAMVVGVAIAIILFHFFVVLIALSRNYFSRRYRKEDRSFSITG